MSKVKSEGESDEKAAAPQSADERQESPRKDDGPTRVARAPSAPARAAAARSLQRTVGNARLGRMLGERVQTKKKVGAPDDHLEHEADRIADRVVLEEEEKKDEKEGKSPAAAGGRKGGRNASSGGRPLSKAERDFMEPRFGRSFEDVRLHTDAEAGREAHALGAKAFTSGPDIAFAQGSGPEDKRLLAHELAHVAQQEDSGPGETPRVQRAPAPPGPTNLQKLDEMLDRSDVPEEEVIELLGNLTPAEKKVVLGGGYKRLIADPLDIGEMVRAVNNLGPELSVKLEWVSAATSSPSKIDYPDIQGMVVAATQAERDALKTGLWRDFFVKVCSDKTMKLALNDLHFDLATKLDWADEEIDLDYSDIKDFVTAAPQPERDALKTGAWRSLFVKVCNDKTMAEAVNDLQFDLSTKLDWMIAEETNYTLVKSAITAAPAGEKATALADQWLLGRLKGELSWNNFAKSVELLGRQAPSAATLLADPTVLAAMASAWTDSNAAVPGPGTKQHEEGGWVYLDLITGALTTRREKAGASAAINLHDPPTVKGSVVVADFHTHPNLGPGWKASASGADIADNNRVGVPGLIRSGVGDFSCGPATRAHLAGSQEYPGSKGGDAPQARADGSYDAK